MLITNDNGEQVEVFTSDELNAKIDEIREETLESANQSKEEEINDLVKQIEDKEKEIANIKLNENDKSKNLSNQREVIENKEKEKTELMKQLEETKSVANQAFNLIKEKTLDDKIKLIAQDEETAKKVKHYYSQFTGEPKDEKEVNERINNAFILASGGASNPISAGVISSAGGYNPNPVGSTEKLNAEQVDLAHKLGLSDEDLKKNKLL
jgi:alanyl-tRNA synthetase